MHTHGHAWCFEIHNYKDYYSTSIKSTAEHSNDCSMKLNLIYFCSKDLAVNKFQVTIIIITVSLLKTHIHIIIEV